MLTCPPAPAPTSAPTFAPGAAGQDPAIELPKPGPIDLDVLMQAHLRCVFGEPDAGRRLSALKKLYAEDATLFEAHATATGHKAISNAVDTLLASLPPEFKFSAASPAVGHHGVARLQWSAGPLNGPAAVTGTDVAHVENGRIRALYVFLDPAPR
jgi:hypothetical protein